MAGIGFELRRMMRKNTLGGLAQAYAYAGLIGSGPWMISIVAVLAIGLLTSANSLHLPFVEQFQVSITYLMACSLILTSPLQLLFTRYTADRLFEKHAHLILPNLLGALTVTILAGTTVAGMALLFWFDGSFGYRMCMLTGFVLLCCIWIVHIFASAIKAFRQILFVFFLGYSVTVGAALGLREHGLEGLMFGFVAGQAVLLFTLLALVVRQYPGRRLVAFSFLHRDQIFPGLAVTGVLYNLGVWADKFIFWDDALTGVSIVGPLRASPIYDLPIFLAYLSIIPGMAVFLIRMEIDLAEQCAKFYRTVTSGGTLAQIIEAKNSLIISVKTGFLEMLKMQAVATLILLLLGDDILALFGISPLYRPLLNINLVAVATQLIVLAVFNVLFYLDQRKIALALCLLFVVSNIAFSIMSLNAGPAFYGYGFASAVFVTTVAGLICLSRVLDRLEFETFMLQPANG
jgi:uncharacterized membrane protein